MDWEHFYSSFRKPDFIPGYEIQNRLGGGAFGDVYKARKVSIDKPFAIKFLKIDEATSRSAIERELEQVRHFSAIDHPNLVTIEDMGVAEDVPYLVMGYAGEDTLARRLKRERPGGAHALALFVQTCRGVAALHERRLAHFDLKPSNVFLKGDVARVGDYGLAKLLIDGRQTLSFGRGTPQYMAPEMLKNRADERADIYSLGVILYELYTGKLPFETSADAGVVLRESDDPPAFHGDVPERVRVAVTCCLRLDPARRFQSVASLLAALGQTARAGDPLVAIETLPPWVGPTPGGSPEGAGPPTPSAPSRPTPLQDPTPAARRGELRSTATDLTRGAVEVARGVWEGLKSPRPTPPFQGAPPTSRSLSTPPVAPAPTSSPMPVPASAPTPIPTPPTPRTPPLQVGPAAARAPLASAPPPIPIPAPVLGSSAGRSSPWSSGDSDILSIQTLEEAARESALLRSAPSPLATRTPSPAGVALFDAASATSSPPSVTWSGTATAAVPVPPRSSRGVFGALRATFELGFEVLTTLITGPVVRAIGGVGRAGGEFVRGGRGWFVAGLRLTLFLGGMLVLGAGLMFLVFLFVQTP